MLNTALLCLLASTTLAVYTVVDDYPPDDFAGKFDFFIGDDPTHGYVDYVDHPTAQSLGLYGVSNGQVYMGVDSTQLATGRGRRSVRVASKASYQHGLIILDLAHMPGGQCGTWPAFWLLGTRAEWPNSGEVDIIEGVNSGRSNSMAIHTNAGCHISNAGGMSGQLMSSDCDVHAPGQGTNQGCTITSSNTESYGAGFNAAQGGVYATQWTSDGFSVWHFPRRAIPSDIVAGRPDPSGWGLPGAKFSGDCDWDEKVVDQQIIFDTTFCGDWAGDVWSADSTCAAHGPSCQSFVQNNPTAFSETYWTINKLTIYQDDGQASFAGKQSLGSTSAIPVSMESSTLATVVSTTATPPTPFQTNLPPTASDLPVLSSSPSSWSSPWLSATDTASRAVGSWDDTWRSAVWESDITRSRGSDRWRNSSLAPYLATSTGTPAAGTMDSMVYPTAVAAPW